MCGSQQVKFWQSENISHQHLDAFHIRTIMDVILRIRPPSPPSPPCVAPKRDCCRSSSSSAKSDCLHHSRKRDDLLRNRQRRTADYDGESQLVPGIRFIVSKRLNASFRFCSVISSPFDRAVSRAASFTTQAASLMGRPASNRAGLERSKGSCGRSVSIPRNASSTSASAG